MWIAATNRHTSLVEFLVSRGADPEQPAYDGTTPFFMACFNGDMPMVCLLHSFGVDMTAVNADNTAPVHVATRNGHLEIVKFLQKHGMSMNTKGTVYTDVEFCSALVEATPLKIAQFFEQRAIVQFLSTESSDGPNTHSKRVRSQEPMLERARRAGVADRLKPIPAHLHSIINAAGSSREERECAKKTVQKLQVANQQIVARAEKARLKQTTLR